MADMTTIKGRIAETIYPNGTGAITAESHQALLLEIVDDINEKKADKEEVTFVDEKVTILANETGSSVQNLQDELTELSERIDNLPKGEEFDAEGNYPSLRVGTADTAIDLTGRGESVPAEFGFRASGGKSIKDGRAYIKRIKGNSVVWNQNINNVLSASTSVRAWSPRRGLDYASIENGEITLRFDSQSDAFGNSIRQRINVKAGDKFFISYDYESHNVDQFGRRMYIAFTSGWSSRGGLNDNCSAKGGDVTGHVEAIEVVPSRDDIDSICFYFCYTGIASPDTTPLKVSKFRFVNLTKMFGAEEAAKINTIEDYNARKPIVEDEYAYNEGQVIHCNTESIKSVGDNAWDEQWEVGTISAENGRLQQNSDYWRTKNPIRVIPGATYYISGSKNDNLKGRFYTYNGEYIGYVDGKGIAIGSQRTFVAPSNAAFFMFTPNVAVSDPHTSQFCIRLAHSGYKTDYEPYWQDTLPLPIIRKYFPNGMKKAGTAHDEIRFNKASGKWEYSKSKTGGGKIKSVDLGAFNWKTDGVASGMEGVRYESLTKLDNCVSVSVSELPNILCAKYASVTANDAYRLVTGISLKSKGTLSLADTTIADVNALKASLQSVILYYECNDWEWVELDAEDQNFRNYYNVADFGTEEAIPATDAEGNIIPSANFSADIIYQFNAVDMIREHELEITELQKVIATMQAQLTALTNGGQ